MARDHKHYEAIVEEVHSGDDLVLLVDLGIDGLHKRVRARLRGVDTPSAFRARENTLAGEVRELVKAWVGNGRCSILLHSQGKGGWLITLLVATDGQVRNVNDMLIERGYVYQNRTE